MMNLPLVLVHGAMARGLSTSLLQVSNFSMRNDGRYERKWRQPQVDQVTQGWSWTVWPIEIDDSTVHTPKETILQRRPTANEFNPTSNHCIASRSHVVLLSFVFFPASSSPEP